MKRIALLFLFSVLFACSGPQGDATVESTIPSLDDPERLLTELATAGVEARQIEGFSSEPVGGEGLLLCVGSEELRVYRFESDEAAADAAARIDPADPSQLENAIVEWTGNPRFWRRGPMLVLYLGEDQATEILLIDLMGEPFARGAGAGRGLGLPGPCTP